MYQPLTPLTGVGASGVLDRPNLVVDTVLVVLLALVYGLLLVVVDQALRRKGR